MYKIIDKKSSGKTLRLMLLAKEKHAVFLCNDPVKMREKAVAYGLSDIEFISFEDFLTKEEVKEKYQYHIVIIDEIDAFVGRALAHNNGTVLTGFSVCTDD